MTGQIWLGAWAVTPTSNNNITFENTADQIVGHMNQEQRLNGSWSCASGQRVTLRKLKEWKTTKHSSPCLISTIKSCQQFPVQDTVHLVGKYTDTGYAEQTPKLTRPCLTWFQWGLRSPRSPVCSRVTRGVWDQGVSGWLVSPTDTVALSSAVRKVSWKPVWVLCKQPVLVGFSSDLLFIQAFSLPSEREA